MTMNLFSSQEKRPLADRIRPKTLEDYIGQTDIVGEGKFLHTLITQGKLTSLILWGPPGTGKTTLARIIAGSTQHAFEEISAVTSGLPEVKKVIERAAERRRLGQGTLLFVDEIHRFNKAQQDAFLPHVENGMIILIGATTENPSFEVIGPLLSRSRVVTLKPLDAAHLEAIIGRAMGEFPDHTIDSGAVELLAHLAAGDARVALGGLEAATEITSGTITTEHIRQALQTTSLKYDKGGDYHYNIISAYIKSLRASHTDAALYYLARMLEGGEDPKFIARRLVIFASEDIGIADNAMLGLALAAFQAIERVGLPEGRITLAHATVALSHAPKDRSSYDALGVATLAAREHPDLDVPLHLRNAPTKLMKDLGYSRGYRWEAEFQHAEGFLPPQIADAKFWRDPTPQSNNP